MDWIELQFYAMISALITYDIIFKMIIMMGVGL